jgi:hypothetical protein
MSRACSTNGGEEECIQDIGGKAGKKGTLTVSLHFGVSFSAIFFNCPF